VIHRERRAHRSARHLPAGHRRGSVEVYEAGGVLQRFAQDFLAANKAA
jgi:hypothetical protein